MKVKYNVICLDAKYDEEAETLVLICDFPSLSEKRVIYFYKKDFTYMGGPVPDEEMHKTAKLWIGKPWVFEMEDSVVPNSDKEEFAHEQVYMNAIGNKMMEITEEMQSNKNIMETKVDSLLKAEAERKLKESGL